MSADTEDKAKDSRKHFNYTKASVIAFIVGISLAVGSYLIMMNFANLTMQIFSLLFLLGLIILFATSVLALLGIIKRQNTYLASIIFGIMSLFIGFFIYTIMSFT